jgi:hypothetical protein
MHASQAAFQDVSNSSNGFSSVIDIDLDSLYYGDFKAVRDTHLAIKKNTVTAP